MIKNKKYSFPIGLMLLLLMSHGIGFAQYSIKIIVNGLPALHKGDAIFVAGNFNGWNPGSKDFELKKEGRHLALVIPALPGGAYEFKFTRGSWDKVACSTNGTDLANYAVQLSSDSTLTYNIEAWKDDFGTVEKKHTASAHVSVLDTAFFMPGLNRYRRLWVYLPASYSSAKKYYPVLYMHDGQNIFDDYTSGFGEWGVDECLDSIMKNGKNECIVVGIDNGPERLKEYNPFDHEKFGAGEGKAYTSFLTETLKPFIDARFRTLKDKANTMIAGSSMGGLISYYAQLANPGVFGKSGVFSPAFWTAPGIKLMTDTLAKNANGKFFFYMGAQEGEAYMSDMYEVLQKLGTQSAALIYVVTDPEGKHNEAAWRKWFPEFFRFMMADWTNYLIKPEEN